MKSFLLENFQGNLQFTPGSRNTRKSNNRPLKRDNPFERAMASTIGVKSSDKGFPLS